jgi:hypothetical protein
MAHEARWTGVRAERLLAKKLCAIGRPESDQQALGAFLLRGKGVCSVDDGVDSGCPVLKTHSLYSFDAAFPATGLTDHG